MRCNNCNTECPNTATTCWRCGAQLRNANQGMQRGAQRGGYGNASIGAAQAAKKPLGAGAIAGIVGGAVALVAIIVVIIVVAAKGGSGSDVKYSSYIGADHAVIAVNSSGGVYCTDFSSGGDEGSAYGAYDDLVNWDNMKAVYTSEYLIAGIKNDGTVIVSYPNTIISNYAAYGEGDYDNYQRDNHYDTSDLEAIKRESANWTDIVQLSFGYYVLYGLKSDGTVVVAGAENNDFNVSELRDVKRLPDYVEEIMPYVKKDGTAGIIFTDGMSLDEYVNYFAGDDSNTINDFKSVFDLSSWKDIAYISDYFVPIGITNDGNVVINGDWQKMAKSNPELTKWSTLFNRIKQYTNVKKILFSKTFASYLILKRDGTVVYESLFEEDYLEEAVAISKWRNVEDIAIYSPAYYKIKFIGLKNDGTLYTAGGGENADFAGWTGIKTDGIKFGDVNPETLPPVTAPTIQEPDNPEEGITVNDETEPVDYYDGEDGYEENGLDDSGDSSLVGGWQLDSHDLINVYSSDIESISTMWLYDDGSAYVICNDSLDKFNTYWYDDDGYFTLDPTDEFSGIEYQYELTEDYLTLYVPMENADPIRFTYKRVNS